MMALGRDKLILFQAAIQASMPRRRTFALIILMLVPRGSKWVYGHRSGQKCPRGHFGPRGHDLFLVICEFGQFLRKLPGVDVNYTEIRGWINCFMYVFLRLISLRIREKPAFHLDRARAALHVLSC